MVKMMVYGGRQECCKILGDLKDPGANVARVRTGYAQGTHRVAGLLERISGDKIPNWGGSSAAPSGQTSASRALRLKRGWARAHPLMTHPLMLS